MKRFSAAIFGALLASVLIAPSASAQTPGTFVLRKPVSIPDASAPPNPAAASAPKDDFQYLWTTGEWSDWTSSCSTTATRNRPVSCTNQFGAVADDSMCEADRPISSESSQVTYNCADFIKNGDFSGGLTHWQTDTFESRVNNGVGLTGSNGTPARIFSLLTDLGQNFLPLIPGKTYTLSADCRGTGTIYVRLLRMGNRTDMHPLVYLNCTGSTLQRKSVSITWNNAEMDGRIAMTAWYPVGASSGPVSIEVDNVSLSVS